MLPAVFSLVNKDLQIRSMDVVTMKYRYETVLLFPPLRTPSFAFLPFHLSL